MNEFKKLTDKLDAIQLEMYHQSKIDTIKGIIKALESYPPSSFTKDNILAFLETIKV